MSEIVLFGGTTEGRKLAVFCEKHRIDTVVCVVTQYGEMLLPKSSWLTVHQKPLGREEMEELLQKENPKLVLDATHPYAKAATENIAAACAACGLTYIRVLRETERNDTESGVLWMNSINETVEWLKGHPGNVLVTTGSKELSAFTQLEGFEERIYARVLPDSRALAHCEELGFAKSRLIAMQGPFSLEMNRAMLQMTKARYLVTKESGQAGGFSEKTEAARQLGVTALVIGRPVEEEGVTLKEAYNLLKPYGTSGQCTIYLVGIGMGGPGQWTVQAVEAIKNADVVAGAGRMLKSVAQYLDGKECLSSYKSREILDWFFTKPEADSLAVVYSGDTGFYSGAKQMLEELQSSIRKDSRDDIQDGIQDDIQNSIQDDIQRQNVTVTVIPGISTVSYLCARLQIPWQDVCLASIHGREADLGELLKCHEMVFLLLGGQDPVGELCERLKNMGYGKAMVSVGVRLSYPDEQIYTGTAETLAGETAGRMAGQMNGCLCAALIKRP